MNIPHQRIFLSLLIVVFAILMIIIFSLLVKKYNSENNLPAQSKHIYTEIRSKEDFLKLIENDTVTAAEHTYIEQVSQKIPTISANTVVIPQ